MSKIRQQRTADNIHQIMAELFQRHLRDPRLQEVTITRVLIDRELQHANIYVSAFGDDDRQKDVIAALDSANSFLRHELAGRLRGRTVPFLHFHWDESLQHADRVNEIIDQLDIPPAPDEPETDESIE